MWRQNTAYNVFTAEQNCLATCARTFWERRRQAKKHGLSFGEETVTETFLLDLAITYPGSLTIVPFNKPQEGKTGSDWAWSFESADGKYSYPMMVQAKVLDVHDKEYGHLDHKVGEAKVLQIDRLIEVADRLGFPAFYAFYNHLTDDSRVPNLCHSIHILNSGPQPETWGISLADANAVKATLPDKTFDTHKQHSIPLHCLMCSGGTGNSDKLGTPGLIAKRRSRVFSERSEVPLAEVRSEPIPLIEMAKEVARIENLEMRQSFIDKLRGDFPGVDGVVIIRDGNFE